ncbi:ribonuclease III domain-containing protein [uncultured Clostridium sp.]|uniref:Mini-ribonuclease 3 n=1 Tax=uncultured Clostridium sp. TaxID=59620 RepID=UPI0028ECACDA|nr:ribonuclease III domain-containing protein [uncultured Clostridium sp.]
MSLDIMNKTFTKEEARALNPLVLAFVGDAVYEVLVRIYLVDLNKDMCVNKLHKKAVDFVKANSQSEAIKNIQQYLSEDEIAIYKRGRNAKGRIPKSATVQEYRMATGLEAVVGFLHLTGQKERLSDIFNIILKAQHDNTIN